MPPEWKSKITMVTKPVIKRTLVQFSKVVAMRSRNHAVYIQLLVVLTRAINIDNDNNDDNEDSNKSNDKSKSSDNNQDGDGKEDADSRASII
jgi:hypothetical protein